MTTWAPRLRLNYETLPFEEGWKAGLVDFEKTLVWYLAIAAANLALLTACFGILRTSVPGVVASASVAFLFLLYVLVRRDQSSDLRERAAYSLIMSPLPKSLEGFPPRIQRQESDQFPNVEDDLEDDLIKRLTDMTHGKPLDRSALMLARILLEWRVNQLLTREESVMLSELRTLLDYALVLDREIANTLTEARPSRYEIDRLSREVAAALTELKMRAEIEP